MKKKAKDIVVGDKIKTEIGIKTVSRITNGFYR